MIYGSLAEVERFGCFGLGKRFELAFQHLQKARQSEHVAGRSDILGDEVWANGISREAQPAKDPEFEYHRRYADVHWCREGREEIRWHGSPQGLESGSVYREDRDFGMLRGTPGNSVFLEGDHFVILFPNEPHAPLLGAGLITKVCVKVAMI